MAGAFLHYVLQLCLAHTLTKDEGQCCADSVSNCYWLPMIYPANSSERQQDSQVTSC